MKLSSFLINKGYWLWNIKLSVLVVNGFSKFCMYLQTYPKEC